MIFKQEPPPKKQTNWMTWRRKKITTKIHLLIIIQTSMKTYIDTKLYECRNSKIGRGAVFFLLQSNWTQNGYWTCRLFEFFCTFRSKSSCLYISIQIHFFVLSDRNPFFCFIFRSTCMTIFSRKKVQTDMHIHVQSEYRLITKYVRWAPNIANDIYWFGSCFSMLIVRLKLLHCYLPLNQSANAKLNVNLYAIYYVAMY